MSRSSSIKIASHAPLVYTPNFFKADKAYADFVPDVAGAYREGVEYANEQKLPSAQRLMKDGVKHAIMLTDLQEGFRDHGELPVTGTDDVVLRICVRIINGIVTPYFTVIVYSQDGHPTQHISFDYYWRDANGKPLDLSVQKAGCLTLVDEKKCVFKAYSFGPKGPFDVGFYRPQFDPYDAVDYWKHLQATGQGDIWAFVAHCILGTKGATLHPLLMETIAFACGARSIQPSVISKGHISNTDWFGPLMPCRPISGHPQGSFQKQVVDDFFKPVDTAEFAGVAEDFCDFNMKKQTMDYLTGTEFMSKLRFITDGTAPIIPNAPHVVAQNEKAKKEGVQFITHETPFES